MDLNKQVGEIIASDYRSAIVFRKYGIDFCCGGGKTIDAVCESKGIDRDQLLSELKEIERKPKTNENQYKDWSYTRLIDHIVGTHHAYVRKTLPIIEQYLTKVTKVHSNHNPELEEILTHYKVIVNELSQHMQKEEIILFPYIKEMEHGKENGLEHRRPPFGSILNPIKMMENEHNEAGNVMKEIKRLSNDFTPPEYACNTYIVSFKLLEEFEKDLHMHIHLENNILFPGAIKLEKQLLQ